MDSVTSYIIEYQLIDLEVKYLESKTGKIQRYVDVGLFLKIKSQTGQALFVDRINKNYQDEIEKKAIEIVENPYFPFTRGKSTMRSTFEKYIEPIVMSGVSGLIIYLFYVMRSN